MRFALAASATLALACLSQAAHADSYSFSFGTPSSAFSGSGLLTTGALLAPGEYAITGVTGTAATSPQGAAIPISSILAPGTFPTILNGGTFPANDNTLFAFNGVGNLTQYGLAFLLNNGAQINLYNDGPSRNDALLKPVTGADVYENVPVSITAVAPIPEPSTIALLGTGLLGFAGVARRRFSRA